VGLQILALPSGLVPQAHQAAITYQRGWGKYQRLPMIMFVIIGGDYPIMVDTGTPDAAFVRENFRYGTFERPDGEDPLTVLKPVPLHYRAYQRLPGTQPPWLAVLSRVNPVQDTARIAPGVSAVYLPGRTPGSQGVLVETDAGRYLIAGDNLDSYDNWTGDASTPHIPSGAFSNLIEYTETFSKIESLDCEPIPSHDQWVLDTEVFG